RGDTWRRRVRTNPKRSRGAVEGENRRDMVGGLRRRAPPLAGGDRQTGGGRSMTTDDTLSFSYSRKEAIADGVLIDATETAREAGFRYPVALTSAAWAECVSVPDGVECQDEAGRLWDVLTMLRHATRGSGREESALYFDVLVLNDRTHPK